MFQDLQWRTFTENASYQQAKDASYQQALLIYKTSDSKAPSYRQTDRHIAATLPLKQAQP